MSIIHDLPMPDYIALEALGSSTAHKVITESPFHAKYYQDDRRRSSTVADIGTIAHQILLEGHERGIVVVEADDWRKNEAKAFRDAAYADGKTPILAKQMGGIRKMVEAAKLFVEQTELKGVFGTGNAEVTVTWDENGLPCKARPDYLTKDWHISLKTTAACAEPVSWTRRTLSPMGYHLGLQFYRRGLLANGIDVEHRILVIEQTPPYGCALITLAPSMAAIADSDVERAIKIWKKCVAFGVYPGYGTDTHFAEATAYQIAEAEDRELQFMANGASA